MAGIVCVTEDQTFPAQMQVSTDRRGNDSFGFEPTWVVPVGRFITTTAARNATGDTSELSQAVVVEGPVIGG